MAAAAPARRGFSVVELLVVISVIAVLISILLPSLRSARQAAFATVCQSNLRQSVISGNAYTVDKAANTP